MGWKENLLNLISFSRLAEPAPEAPNVLEDEWQGMSFLERLRKNPPGRRLTEAQLAEIVRFEGQLSEQLSEVERQKTHEERKSKAKNFCSTSGIIPMVMKINGLIGGDFRQIKCCDVHQAATAYPLKEVSSFQPVDRDSALYMIRWDDQEGPHMTSKRNMQIYAEMISKCFVIEMQPDGILKIHAGRNGSSTLPETMWRDNEDVLDGALEKAYNHPGNYKWQEWVGGPSFT